MNFATIRDLASLLAPVQEGVFLDHFLNKLRLHVKAGHADRAKALLPWATMNHLIATDAIPADRLRIVRASVDVPPLMYRRQSGSQELRTGALQALLAQGVSIVINSVDDLVPQIGFLADALERRLAHRVGINAYLSFGQGSALKPHADDHDVLVVQVHGRKRWRSYGSPFALPVEKRKSPKFAPEDAVWEDTLEPGDVLYLPRGEVHEAALAGAHSVHLTIAIVTGRGVDFINWLSKQAAADLAFRTDITRLGGDAALRQQAADLRARLHALIDTARLDDFLDAQDAERSPRPLLNMGHIGDDAGPAEHTVVTPALRRRISLGSGEEAVEIGGERYRLSAHAQRVLGLLAERNALEFGELLRALADALGRDEARAAVLELARSGLVSFEEQAGG
jgi:ribosomal protein L16 Arg81 hydroxylase